MLAPSFRKAFVSVLVFTFIAFTATSAIAGPIILKFGWTTAAGETDPYAITARQFSCQGKSETLGFYIDVDEIGYCYPVGDHSK